MDSVELAVFSGRLNAICEEMGFTLQRTALSPNIKDRLDYSCAFFDVKGCICSQAAHIPVHLGSMAYAMTQVVNLFEWESGDVVVLNDPFLGGTHLPDITLISPVFLDEHLIGFFANRAHHANIGASSPGSMPLSSDPESEGVLISPMKLFSAGAAVASSVALIQSINRFDSESSHIPGDFLAQLSANKVGCERLNEWLGSSPDAKLSFIEGLEALNNYGRRLTLQVLASLPEGRASYIDYMDGDGFGADDIPIVVTLELSDSGFKVDFTGTHKSVTGNINCPLSVCVASVYYVFVCLLPDYIPCCQGTFDCIEVVAPEGCLVNALPGVPVAAGNVETSMRVVDVLIGALTKLGVPLPAASQGTMNNVAFGCAKEGLEWDYYETLGGGMGAGTLNDGISSVQCHMTNTLNTPIESLELHYPLCINEYSLRRSSGGNGVHRGGGGLRRSYEFLSDASVTILSERRTYSPWGAEGGEDGASGNNLLNGSILPSKVSLEVKASDVIMIETPGGGGWGKK